jgi:hypothetical protein
VWDERYSIDDYVYGTDPNTFLVEHAGLLQGPVLSLAEGEGRNAVFLATQGLEVHGVDGSRVGLAKRRRWRVSAASRSGLNSPIWVSSGPKRCATARSFRSSPTCPARSAIACIHSCSRR